MADTLDTPETTTAPEQLVELTSLSDGERRKVPASRAQDYIKAGVARETTMQELQRERQLDSLSEDPLAQAANFGTSTLRSFSAGLSDVAAVGLGSALGYGDETKNFLRDLQDANEGSATTLAGEVLGGIGQGALALATGGASVAATEGAAVALGARAAAQGLLRGAAKEAAINVVDGAARQINDDWLRDKELSAERALAAGGVQGLLGGALHGTIGGAALLGRKAGEAVAEGVGKFASKERVAKEALLGGSEAAQEAFAREFPDGGADLQRLATEVFDGASTSDQVLAKLTAKREAIGTQLEDLVSEFDVAHTQAKARAATPGLGGEAAPGFEPAKLADAVDQGIEQLRSTHPETAIKLEARLAEFRNAVVDDRGIADTARSFMDDPEFIGGGRWGDGIAGKLKQRINSLLEQHLPNATPRQQGGSVSDVLVREIRPEIEHEVADRISKARAAAKADGNYAAAAEDAYEPRRVAKAFTEEPWMQGADPELSKQLKEAIYAADELAPGQSITAMLEGNASLRKTLAKLDQDVMVNQAATSKKYADLDLGLDEAVDPGALPSQRFAQMLQQVRETEGRAVADGVKPPPAPVPGMGQSILEKFDDFVERVRGMEVANAKNADLTPAGMVTRRAELEKLLGLDDLQDSNAREAARRALAPFDAELERQWRSYSPEQAELYAAKLKEQRMIDIAHDAVSGRASALDRARGSAIEGTLAQAARYGIGGLVLGGSPLAGIGLGIANSPGVRDVVRNKGLGFLLRNDFVKASAGIFSGFDRAAAKGQRAASVATKVFGHAQIEARRKEIDEALQPGSVAEMAAKSADPALGEHMDRIRVRNTQMLRDALPTPLTQQGLELGRGRTPVYSAQEVRRYQAVERAVTAPQETLRRIANGTASQEELRALEQAHPRQFAAIREAAIARAANINKPLTDREANVIRGIIGLLPGRKAVGTWAQMVAEAAAQTQGGGPAPSPGGGGPVPAGGGLAPATSVRLEGKLGM